ncbi:MAG: HAD family phosphatase [Lachnospiraceae bacterium]|nr:HAD family phosphatase [Lachnospiraceae bacterium]
MIRTVVFDLGKVLVEFHPIEGMKKLGFSKEVMERFQSNIFSGLWEQCDAKPIGKEEIRDLFKRAVPGLEREVDFLWDHITVVTGVYDYSHQWILDLKRRGYQVFILSNYGQQAFEANAKVYPFLKDVDGMVISYQVEMVKPNPKIYQYLAEKYQIKPEEAVFLDDRKENVDGAAACGFSGIVFENYKQAREELERLLRE